MRILLGAVTLGWIALFSLGALMGDVRPYGWLSFACGAVVGVLLAWTSRRLEVAHPTAEAAARVAFVIALLFLTWGLVTLLQGSDPLTGDAAAGYLSVRVEILLLLSAGPACVGLLLLAMRDG